MCGLAGPSLGQGPSFRVPSEHSVGTPGTTPGVWTCRCWPHPGSLCLWPPRQVVCLPPVWELCASRGCICPKSSSQEHSPSEQVCSLHGGALCRAGLATFNVCAICKPWTGRRTAGSGPWPVWAHCDPGFWAESLQLASLPPGLDFIAGSGQCGPLCTRLHSSSPSHLEPVLLTPTGQHD